MEGRPNDEARTSVKGRRALVFGLGVLGGGLWTTKWLLREGADVRITDKRTAHDLGSTLGKLGQHERLTFALGGHDKRDIDWADFIVVNPGVPSDSPFLAYARKIGKTLLNDAALFMDRCERPVVAVTGTRGKTTTTAWIAALLSAPGEKPLSPTGNTPENPLLREIQRRIPHDRPVVAELSSWQLELMPVSDRAPSVAVITNLYPDHLNRYPGIEAYADAKANIFVRQGPNDTLIVNADHSWTDYFLKKRPKSRVVRVTTGPLPQGVEGVGVKNGVAYTRSGGRTRPVVAVRGFRERFGEHNLMNLLQAIAAAHAVDPTLAISERRILGLEAPRFRQEIISRSPTLTVVNDTTATSPDGTIAALKRFSATSRVVLIVGGTDKELDFADLAKEIASTLAADRVVFLEGSATSRLLASLKERRGWNEPIVEDSLRGCINRAMDIARQQRGHATVLFSPGAASFEKFKNEFDRGRKFSRMAVSVLRRKRPRKSSH